MDEKKIKKIPAYPAWMKESKRTWDGIGIYCRVSTSQQRQLRSLSNQITSLIKTVQGWGCLPYLKDVYVDIYTGTSENKRPEFNRMLGDVKDGKIKVVVTKSIQRFGRNTDNIITIIEGIAQDESYFKSENIKFGIRGSLRKPDSPYYNRPCYGYWTYEGKMVPEPIIAGIVKDIFAYYKYGRSLRGIARKLEERGIESPTGKKVWRIKTIENILKNDKYTGNVTVKSVVKNPQTGEEEFYRAVYHHEGIISQELFDEVQKLFVERSNIEIGPDGKKKRKSTHYSSKKRQSE